MLAITKSSSYILVS